MGDRKHALLDPPVGFAHRGGRAHAPDNTIEAFELARRLGATGLESDVYVTADGVAVLDHDGLVGRRGRRRRIDQVQASELPDHVPTLADLYMACGTEFELSLDVKADAAVEATIAVAAEFDAEDRLWLCGNDWKEVAGWRAFSTTARLIDSTRRSRIKEGLEIRSAQLAEAGIDGLNLHRSDWTEGHAATVHRFGLFALGWDAQHRREIDELVSMGLDGIFSDHVDRLVEAIR